MFSRAKRFDYPKPDANESLECYRYLKNNSKSSTLNSTLNSTSTRCSQKKKKDNIMKEKTPKKGKKNDKGIQVYEPLYDDDISMQTAPDVISPTEIGSLFNFLTSEDDVQTPSTSSTATQNEFYYSSVEVVAEAEIHQESGYHQIQENSNIDDYINTLEQKIEQQRQHIGTLRSQLLASSDEGFQSSHSSSIPVDIQDRLKRLEELTRACIQETLDFVTQYNKESERKGAVRPENYTDLVDFCAELIADISSKLSDKKGKKMRKFKNLCNGFVKPFKMCF